MYLKHLELRNFCQHEYFSQHFPLGMSCIIGPNGSGKSNLVNAIKISLLGFTRFGAASKKDLIRYNKPVQESSYIKSTWITRDGVEFDIIRVLAQGSDLPSEYSCLNQALIYKDNMLTSNDEITEWILNKANIQTIDVMDNHFIEQWKVFSLLHNTGSERAKALQDIFQFGKCEIIWELLGSYEQQIISKICEIDLVELENICSDLESKLTDLNRELLEYPNEIVNWDPTSDPSIKLVREYNEYQSLLANKESLEKMCKVYENQIISLQQQIAKLDNELASLPSVDIINNQINTLHRKLSHLHHYDWVVKRKEALTSKQEELLKEREKLYKSKPIKPENYLEPEHEPGHYLLAYKYHIYYANELQTATSSVLCPLCKNVIYDPKKLALELQQELDSLRLKWEKYKELYKQSRDFDKAISIYEQKIISLDKELDKINNEIKSLISIDVEPIPEDSKSLVEELRLFEAQLDRLKQLHFEKRELSISLSSIELKRDECLQQLERLNDKLLAFPKISESEIAEAQEGFRRKQKLYEQYLSSKVRFNELSSRLLEYKKKLEKAREKDVLNKKAKKALDILTPVRSAYKRNNFPQELLQNMLGLVMEKCNEILNDIDFGLRWDTNDPWSFRVIFADGKIQPATRLSGGEKVMLSLLLRLVINQLTSPFINFLVLDEPTAGLDDLNLKRLSTIFRVAQSTASKLGLQIILITHEQFCEEWFDDVIKLSSSSRTGKLYGVI